LQQLEFAYKIEENSFLASKMLALMVVLQESELVEQRARDLVARHPESSSLHFLYGNILLEKKDHEAALREFKLAHADPELRELASLHLVSAYEQAGNNKQAIRTAEAMQRQFPHSVAALLKLSHLFLQQQNSRAALRYLAAAYKLRPEEEEIALRYALMLDFSDKSKDALEIYRRFLGRSFDLDTLNGQMERLLQISGGEAKYFVQQLQQLLLSSRGEQRIGLHLLRCYLFIALGQEKLANEDLQILEQEKTTYPALPFLLGVAYERLGKGKLALAHYRQIAKEEKHFIWANQRMIMLLQQSDSKGEALTLALDLVAYKHANWEAYLLAANIYESMQRYQEAIDLLEIGVRRYPHKVKLLYMQGVLQEKSGQFKQCIATVNQVIKRDPFFHSAFNFLGYLYAERGENLDEAEKLVTTALDLKPGDGYYLDSLGMVHFQKGNFEKALTLYLRAIAQEPEEGVIIEHAGDVYYRQQKKDLAANYWQKALEKNLEEKDRQRILEKLRALETQQT
jgi:tetratricopeptide (TPR) repeat protein